MEPLANAVERARGLARLLAMLADPPPPERFGDTVCQLACRHLHVDAAALFLGASNDDPPARLGAAGFVAAPPPDGVPASLASADVTRLHAWASQAGYAQLELAVVTVDARPSGLFALFTVAGKPFDAVELEIIGLGVSRALQQARAARELTRAFEQQDREQDQVVRAERMRALGEMARGIAHDFNNVLNAILGQTGVLAALVADRPAATEALERLRKVALDGAATIRRVQEFSGTRRDRDFDRVDVAELVRRAADEVRARDGAQLHVDAVISTRRPVRGNADELEELLRALVDNAVEAMPDGGALTLELGSAGDDIALAVADTGSGMSASVRARSLDPFFTTKGSRKKGLGLALAAGIVRRHGGMLDIESQLGRGTRVRVRLPAAAATSENAVVATSAPDAGDRHVAAASAGKRVLLVEDDPDNREAMSSLLQLGGFDVTAADCGAADVRAFADGTFDVVLTDLGLPDMDGWQVAGEIKQAAPTMPVALITGWGLNLDRDEIRRRGVDLLVKKPLDPRSFIGQIEALVQSGRRKPSA